MLKIPPLFILVFLLISCAKKQPKHQDISEVKLEATFEDLEGKGLELSDFKGQRVLVNFWATWCTPCLEEMPSMEKAQELLKDDNYVFLFATTDTLEKIQKFKANKPYPFKFIRYNGTLDKLNIYALPATFVYNTNGELSRRIDGMTDWSSEEVLSMLRAIQ